MSLVQRWQEHVEATPRARIFDVAQALGVSELELVAAGCGVEATRLVSEFGEILTAVGDLGTVMALTRNDHAVIEKTGEYDKVEVFGRMGLVLNPGIDLRLFLTHWRHAYAVVAPKEGGTLRSIQFFDRHGTAIHKIYVKDEARVSQYDALVDRFAARGDEETLVVEPRPAKPEPAPSDVDRDALRRDWEALKDTHDFFKLLKTHGVAREQALRLVGDDLAAAVAPGAARACLELARDRACPIMVFVGNDAVIEIHTGVVRQLKALGPWYNVLDPGFNLHLREDRVARAWVVRKPTADGVVTSLELFAEDGFLIAQLFGERKPGKPELAAWREIVEAVQAQSV